MKKSILNIAAVAAIVAISFTSCDKKAPEAVDAAADTLAAQADTLASKAGAAVDTVAAKAAEAVKK